MKGIYLLMWFGFWTTALIITYNSVWDLVEYGVILGLTSSVYMYINDDCY